MRKRAPGGGSFRAYIYFLDHDHRPHPVERKKGGRGMPGMMDIGGAEKNFCGLTGAGVTGASLWRGEKRHGRKEP